MMTRNPDPDTPPPDVAEPDGELARQWHVPALAATILLLAAVVVALPVAIGSMIAEFRGRQGVIYDLQSGAAVDPDCEECELWGNRVVGILLARPALTPNRSPGDARPRARGEAFLWVGKMPKMPKMPKMWGGDGVTG